MKLVVTRRGLEIVPETEQDVSYIEDTLGLAMHQDVISLVREDLPGARTGFGAVTLRTRTQPRRAFAKGTATPAEPIELVG